jgi:hypothetical protein
MSRQNLPTSKYFWYSFLLEAESNPGPSAAGRITSMKNSSDTVGNRICDLPVCSGIPQPTMQILNTSLAERLPLYPFVHIFYLENKLATVIYDNKY